MAVEVYYWVGFPGHLALRVDGGTPVGSLYLSRWPSTFAAVDGLFGGPGRNNSFADDMKAEGMRRPLTVRLTKLDETAVKKAVEYCNKHLYYHDFVSNCSSYVRFCLEVGTGAVRFVATELYDLVVDWLALPLGCIEDDTPPGVYSYACSLRASFA